MRQVEIDSSSDEESKENDYYTFSIFTSDNDKNSPNKRVSEGEIMLKMIINSGASCNIIDRETWESLKRASIECKCGDTVKIIFSYGRLGDVLL